MTTRPIQPPADAADRLSRLSQDAGACRLWTGAVNTNGYGAVGWAQDGRRVVFQAHRVAYAVHVGPIPTGAHVHHTCGNPLCVNPSHLRPITQAEHNALHAPTYCKRGHLLAETAATNGPRARTCGVCRKERDATRRAR